MEFKINQIVIYRNELCIIKKICDNMYYIEGLFENKKGTIICCWATGKTFKIPLAAQVLYGQI